MLHQFPCTKCKKGVLQTYCFEELHYTKKGQKRRARQVSLGLCDKCFGGKIPQRKRNRPWVPILVVG